MPPNQLAISPIETPVSKERINRICSLDYLRGMAAFGIMLYHYFIWTVGEFASDTFIGRFGIYGVAIFYLLSGLTLYAVYHERMIPTRSSVLDFAVKRVCRIFPLLWLTTIVSIYLEHQSVELEKFVLNMTGLFGFLDWGSYYATGAWSIGNELVFYAFFPLFIFLSKKSKPAFVLLSILVFLVYLYFTFIVLNVSQPLGGQWNSYVNPLNQLPLFLCGIWIGKGFKDKKIGVAASYFILSVGLILFVFYPAAGNLINIVTDLNRIVFTVSCLLICIGFYKAEIKLPALLNKPFVVLGEISYSVYLLHPIVYKLVGENMALLSFNSFPFTEPARLVVSVILTLGLSYFVYEKFEKYFIKLGRPKNDLSPVSNFTEAGKPDPSKAL